MKKSTIKITIGLITVLVVGSGIYLWVYGVSHSLCTTYEKVTLVDNNLTFDEAQAYASSHYFSGAQVISSDEGYWIAGKESAVALITNGTKKEVERVRDCE